MSKKYVECNSCSVHILEETKIGCDGYCMPCFMRNNNGFRPSEVQSIKEKGFSELAGKWSDLVRQGQLNIRNPLISQKLNMTFPIIYKSVNGFFRSENSNFDDVELLKLLADLKSEPDDELNQYASRVEEYILELIRGAKS